MINKYIDQGYISKRKHPNENLYILNYTPKTQYEGFWNEYTINCRGLIIDEDGNIKARCFKKFFNYEEVKSEVLDRVQKRTSFQIQEKVDGSLGILYWIKDKPFIATRGSFDSDQAKVATEILHSYDLSNLSNSLTYLFEIIYPENRICVNYGSKKDLVFLSAFEIKTGKEISPSVPFPVAQAYGDLGDSFDFIQKLNWNNKEGFVVRFTDGYRFKIKFEDYKRLHRIIFSISSKSIWQSLRSEKDFSIDEVPDELYSWIKKESEFLKSRYLELEIKAKQAYDGIKNLPRKEFAMVASKYSYSSVLFKMLDKKPYNDIIWKMIEPEYRTPNATIQEET